MQGKGISLRLGLLGLVVVLVLSAVGGLSLAKDAFDGNDYEDCPAATRLDAVSGLAIDRTDDEKEIRISWDALTNAELGSLGPNGYRARLTVIVEGSGGDKSNNVALGDTSLVVDEVTFATELTVSVAITLGDFVISDIAEKEFTSGMPAPVFSATLKEVADADGETTGYPGGDQTQNFYYLGFNDTFDNWFVKTPPTAAEVAALFSTKPATVKFRVGLAHAGSVANPDDADFDHYRIVIEDGSGDLLGYQAQTVNATSRTYDGKVLVFGVAGEAAGQLDAADLTIVTPDDTDTEDVDESGTRYVKFTNIRLSNRVTDDAQLSPYYAAVIDGSAAPDGVGLSYANVVEAAPAGALYVEPPAEYFDFPSDVFDDDGNYIIKAWAEDDDGTRISPVASIELGVQEGDPMTNSTYEGYLVTLAVGNTPRSLAVSRGWGEAADRRRCVESLLAYHSG